MPRYIVVLKESDAAAFNAWLQGHPQLDARSGGGATFTIGLALLSDPDDGSVVRGRWCDWSMPGAWWTALKGRFENQILADERNTSDEAKWRVSWYPATTWTPEQVLADTTRKPRAVKVVPVETP